MASRHLGATITVTIALACLLPVALLMWFFQFPAIMFPRTLTDANRLVAVQIPPGWQDVTGDARAIEWADSGYFYIEPDIRARTNGPNTTSYLRVTIELAPFKQTADTLHREAVEREQETHGLNAPGDTTSTPGGGYITVLSEPGRQNDEISTDYTVVVRTVMTDQYSAVIVGNTNGLADSEYGRQVVRIVENTRTT